MTIHEGDTIAGDKITGDITATNISGTVITIGHGNNVQVTTIYEWSRRQPAHPDTIHAAGLLLDRLPTDQIPPPSPSLPPGSIAPSRVPTFVGREPDLRAIAAALKGGQTTAINQAASVHGLGGVGKTTVATEFVHRYGGYFAGGVFWLNFDTPANIPTEIARCGGEKGLQLRPDFHTLPLPEQVDAMQRAWAEEIPRLLVFDNVDSDDAEALVAHYRPPTGGCRVLITSRRGVWDTALGIAALPLGVLSRPESVDLLRQFRADLTTSAAEAIAAELGDLPLALHLAGSFLKKYGRTQDGDPATFLSRLHDPKLLEHPALQGRATGAAWSYHERSVARAFALSYERLDPDDAVDTLALALLARAAHFAPGEPIPSALLLATVENADELQATDALERLVSLGLLEEDAAQTATLHRLVARFVQQVAADETARDAVELTMLTTARRLNEAARPSYERALEIVERVLGPAHPQTALSLNNLAALLESQGAYEQARPLSERALAIYEQLLGPAHPDTAQSLNNLAGLHRSQGAYEQARPLSERALAIREEVLGPAHPQTAGSLNNLAGLHQDQGAYEQARPLLERALAIREQVLGPAHPDTATSLNNLAGLLEAQGAYEQARPLSERALAIYEQVLGPAHPDTQAVHHNLEIIIGAIGVKTCIGRAKACIGRTFVVLLILGSLSLFILWILTGHGR